MWKENVQLKAKGAAEHGEFAGSGLGPAGDTSCIQAKGSEPAFVEYLFCPWQCAGAISSILQISKLRFRKEEVASLGSHNWLYQSYNLKQSSALLGV